MHQQRLPPCLEQRLDGLYDGVGVDLGRVEQFGGLARTGHVPHGKLDHGGSVVAHADEGVQHSIAQTALKPVIFGDDQFAAGILRGPVQRLFVNRLDRVGVNQADADALGFEPIVGLVRLADVIPAATMPS